MVEMIAGWPVFAYGNSDGSELVMVVAAVVEFVLKDPIGAYPLLRSFNFCESVTDEPAVGRTDGRTDTFLLRRRCIRNV